MSLVKIGGWKVVETGIGWSFTQDDVLVICIWFSCRPISFEAVHTLICRICPSKEDLGSSCWISYNWGDVLATWIAGFVFSRFSRLLAAIGRQSQVQRGAWDGFAFREMSRTLSRLKSDEETWPRKLCTRIAVSSYLSYFLPPSTQVQPFGGSGTAPVLFLAFLQTECRSCYLSFQANGRLQLVQNAFRRWQIWKRGCR